MSTNPFAAMIYAVLARLRSRQPQAGSVHSERHATTKKGTTMVARYNGWSPEAGWAPFMAWLQDHGANPNEVHEVIVDERAGHLVTVEYKMTDGKPVRVDGKNIALRTVQRPLMTTPPSREDGTDG